MSEEEYDSPGEWVTAVGKVEDPDSAESILVAAGRLSTAFPTPWVDFSAADMCEAYYMGLSDGWQLP